MVEDLGAISEWKKRVKIAKEIAKSVQDELRIWIAKHDELVIKYMLIEKKLENVKKLAKCKISSNK